MIYNNGTDKAEWLKAKPVNDVFAANPVGRASNSPSIAEAEANGVEVSGGKIFIGYVNLNPAHTKTVRQFIAEQ